MSKALIYSAMILADDVKLNKPFAHSDMSTYRTVVGSWDDFSIHASPEKWEKLAEYCLECAATLPEANEC